MNRILTSFTCLNQQQISEGIEALIMRPQQMQATVVGNKELTYREPTRWEDVHLNLSSATQKVKEPLIVV